MDSAEESDKKLILFTGKKPFGWSFLFFSLSLFSFWIKDELKGKRSSIGYFEKPYSIKQKAEYSHSIQRNYS